MKTIVVAFDQTDVAERALRRAADLAEALDASLVVTTVAVPPVPAPGIEVALPGTTAQLAAEATDRLDLADEQLERARQLLEGRSLRAEFVAEAGPPADRIVAVADESDADLIVVGAGDRGFLERLLHGSVGEDVARHTKRDVLIVH